MEHNFNKSLFELDNSLKPIVSEITPLVRRYNLLLVKKIEDFTIEDLRFMIGQKAGLEYLVPMAANILEKDIFAEGDFYEGDLLQKVLSIDVNFWNKNPQLHNKIAKTLHQEFDLTKIDTTDEIKMLLQNLKDSFIK